MPKAPGKRHGHRQASYGLGNAYRSPHKPRDKTKTRTLVEISDNAERQHALLMKLELLKRGEHTEAQGLPDNCTNQAAEDNNEWVDESMEDDPSLDGGLDSTNPTELPQESTRRTLPDATAKQLYLNWRSLIPTVVHDLLQYKSRTLGKALTPLSDTFSGCHKGCENVKHHKVLCLLLDRTF